MCQCERERLIIERGEEGEYFCGACGRNFTPNTKVNPQPDIPGWIKNVAGWWSSGLISNKEYIESIKFLIDNRVFKTKNIIDWDYYGCNQ